MKERMKKSFVIFGIGPCYSFGLKEELAVRKSSQVINFMSQVSSSATCQSFLELIRKCSVSWHWSFSIGFSLKLYKFSFFKMKWENSRNLRWLETAQRDFQAWVEATLCPLKVPGFPDAPGISRSLHLPFPFPQREQLLESWRNKLFSVHQAGCSNFLNLNLTFKLWEMTLTV